MEGQPKPQTEVSWVVPVGLYTLYSMLIVFRQVNISMENEPFDDLYQTWCFYNQHC